MNPYDNLLLGSGLSGHGGSHVTPNGPAPVLGNRWDRDDSMLSALLILGKAAHPGNWTPAPGLNAHQAIIAHMASLGIANCEFINWLRRRWSRELA